MASHFVDYWNGDGALDSFYDERKATLTRMIKPNIDELDAVLDGEDDILKWRRFLTSILIIKGSETKRGISEIVGLLKIFFSKLKNIRSSRLWIYAANYSPASSKPHYQGIP